jgi:hypothetical protein
MVTKLRTQPFVWSAAIRVRMMDGVTPSAEGRASR